MGNCRLSGLYKQSIIVFLSTLHSLFYKIHHSISIHAPRGGSDLTNSSGMLTQCNFYPRSPWGERRTSLISLPPTAHYFYPRSPWGERLLSQLFHGIFHDFYPRSPWGERHSSKNIPSTFLDFYPRSPWGERQQT